MQTIERNRLVPAICADESGQLAAPLLVSPPIALGGRPAPPCSTPLPPVQPGAHPSPCKGKKCLAEKSTPEGKHAPLCRRESRVRLLGSLVTLLVLLQVYIIGGDGTQRGALAIHNVSPAPLNLRVLCH